jgi:hypothetical protein
MGRGSDVTRRACGFKVGVSGGANRRVTVSAVKANGRPLVHLKVRTGIGEGSKPSDTIDFDMSQAAALVNSLRAAIEAAGADPLLEDIGSMKMKRQASLRAADEAWEAAAPKPLRSAGAKTSRRTRLQQP